MGRVFKQKSGKWALRLDVPDSGVARKQKQIGGFSKKSEAEKELKRLEADILNGEFLKSSDLTVSDFLEMWLNDFVKTNRAPKTYAFYLTLIKRHFLEYFKSYALSSLAPHDIDMFYAHLRNTTSLSANTIHHCHKTLRAALNQAVRWGYIKQSPMFKVVSPKQEKAKSSYWPPDVIPAGLKLFAGDRIEWMVRLALLTGMRLGEICALNTHSLDFKQHVIRISGTAQRVPGEGVIIKRPKTEDSEDLIPMSSMVESFLKAQIQEIANDKTIALCAGEPYTNQYKGYLALRTDGELLDPDYVSKRFRAIVSKQNDVEIITFHDLRHSCASWLIYNGVDLKTIQLILRHSNYSVTANTYAHISQEAKLDALNTLAL